MNSNKTVLQTDKQPAKKTKKRRAELLGPLAEWGVLLKVHFTDAGNN